MSKRGGANTASSCLRSLRHSPFVKRWTPTTTSIIPSSSTRSFHKTTATSQSSKDGSNKPSSSRDVRLAGRRRFYKYVGTESVPPPWETPFDLPISAEETTTTVDSPISAGVDDTQSASGVSVELPTMQDLREMLTPRNPTTGEALPTREWFGVTLDGMSIKTPLGKQLAVPSKQLAWAIAAEWDQQATILTPAQMPLMTLTCTTIDQVAGNPQLYRDLSLQFLPTDTSCFWADEAEDRLLHRQQQDAFQVLHDYCESVLGGKPAVAMGASESFLMTRRREGKEFGLPHPPSIVEKARAWVDSLDAWNLCALHSVAAESKSFFLAKAVLLSTNDTENPFHGDLTKAIVASRIEEEFQIEIWGMVEGGHDYDRLNNSIQIHAAQVLTSSIAVGNME